MHFKSYLLGLSGTEFSRNAAELAWALAERSKAEVIAQHVIDTDGAWDLLGFSKPGFVGSGLFVSAHKAMTSELHTVGNKLVSVYESHFPSDKIKGSAHIEEGDPVEVICKKAQDHDLVIVGHRSRPLESEFNGLHSSPRYSIAESLALHCSKPLLIVQEPCQPWSTVSITSSMDHINDTYLNRSIALALSVSAEPEILCLGTGSHEESAEKFKKNLRAVDPGLEYVRIKVRKLENLETDEEKVGWWTRESDVEGGLAPDTLAVIPTRQMGDKRITIFGASPAYFVRYLTNPSILLWPEDSNTSGEKLGGSVASSLA